MKDALLAVLKSIDWKPILHKLYKDGVRPELVKLVANTESKWDDMALAAADFLVEKFLGGDEQAAKQVLASVAQPQVSDVAQA